MELRNYQRRVLNELEDYFRRARTLGNEALGAKTAFVVLTGRAYKDVPGIENLPYVCLRVPTGGGKTLLGSHTVHVVSEKYLQTTTPTVLWLAPSNAIVSQTLKALRSREHPYRRVLEDKFAGNVKVMELSEALSVTRADLTGAACIIVTTFQALRVDNTEGRKVYESNGSLQHHFDGVAFPERFTVEGVTTYSLANVLSMHRPLVIMDEAHNARTELSFDTLVRFRPSAIVELTATPQREHNPARGQYASNILAHVSAAELKAEEMIKLPIRLRTETDWRLVVRDALDTRRQLAEQAVAERAQTGEYIRPIILFQAQSVEGDDLNVTKLRQSLIDDYQVPGNEIAIHTGKSRGLDGVDVASESCPITCIVTVKALVEGWDCPFAYVLCSVSDVSTPRAVEQVLGRILRLPGAKRKQRDVLNTAYAFATSNSLIETAKNLRDALVESAGFQKLEAADLVIEDTTPPPSLFERQQVTVTAAPTLTSLPQNLVQRVTFESATGQIVVTGEVTAEEVEQIAAVAATPADRQTIARTIRATCAPVMTAGTDRSPMLIPGLSIKVADVWSLFEETHLLEVPWDLGICEPSLDETTFPSAGPSGQTGEIDVTEAGRVEMSNFVATLHRDLSLFANEPGWTPIALTGWMLPRVRQTDVTGASLRSFVQAAIESVMRERHWTIDRVAAEKFRVAESIEERIKQHRNTKRAAAYERFLFAQDAQVETSPGRTMTIDPAFYSPNWLYEGSYRFKKHIGRVGEPKSDGEEFDCAVYIDTHSKVKRWMRNIDRRPHHSFSLQTSSDRFYPDFIAEIGERKWLVVEYKGRDRWTDDDSREKRRLGELWAKQSGGTCAFVMPKGPDMAAIDAAIESILAG